MQDSIAGVIIDPDAHGSVGQGGKPGIGLVHPRVGCLVEAQLSCHGRMVCTLSAELHTQDRRTFARLLPALDVEAHRIEFPIDRQVNALRIAKIALRAQCLDVALLAGGARTAMSSKAVSERKVMAVRPEFARVRCGGDEIGAGHRILLAAAILNGRKRRAMAGLKFSTGYGMFCLCPVCDWNN